MFAISPTDFEWFRFLKENNFNTDINFWTPTPWNIQQLNMGDKFYFRLKAPIKKIGGCGVFKEYLNMSAEEAWNRFGLKNGCGSKLEMIDRLNRYRQKRRIDERNATEAEIGCIVLQDAQFWDEDKYVNLAETDIEFSDQVVKIKYFTVADPFLTTPSISDASHFVPLPPASVRGGINTSIIARKGQGSFKGIITTAYKNSCCISGETTPELLEAAHIQPYLNEDSNHSQNGLLLRVDLHRLYDNGLLYIDEEYTVHISPHLKSDNYRIFQGRQITLPTNRSDWPSIEALKLREINHRK